MKALVAVLSLVLLIACSSGPNKINTEFEEEYKNSKITHTMHSYEYLGEKDGKAYLKKSSMSLFNQDKWNDKVFVASFDELTKETREELKKINRQYKK